MKKLLSLIPQSVKNRFAYWRARPARRAIAQIYSDKGGISSFQLHAVDAAILRECGHVQPPYVPPATRSANAMIVGAFAVAAAIVGMLASGCGTTPTQTAANVETAGVPTVDAAMHIWADYCAGTNATAAQINTVSNAYFVYFNAQIVASNVLAYAASNPGTTVNISNVLSTASTSAAAVVSIVSTFVKK